MPRFKTGQRVVAVRDVRGFFEIVVPAQTPGEVTRSGFFDSVVVLFDNGTEVEVSRTWIRSSPEQGGFRSAPWPAER